MNDFENFIRHSDFGTVLLLADTLKDQKRRLAVIARDRHGLPARTDPSSVLRSKKKNKLSAPDEFPIGPSAQDGNAFVNSRGDCPPSHMSSTDHSTSFDGAAELIRATLIPSANEGNEVAGVMGRGECLITDSLVDETIEALADELRFCLDLKKQLRGVSRQGNRMSEAGLGECQDGGTKQADWMGADVKMEGCGLSGSRTEYARNQYVDEKTNPIANKFSKWQTDILTDWMIEHREHPFPTQSQIRHLAKATKLKDTQVINWTTNVRKRNLKATVELSKKPHNFLDYIFLATDREKKMRKQHPDIDFSFLDNVASKGVGEHEGSCLASGVPPFNTHGRNHHASQSVSAPFKSSLFGNRPPSRPTSQHNEQPNIHHRHPVAQPRAPRNSDQKHNEQPNNSDQKHNEQPNIHHRHPVAPPRAPRNSDQIFRRGKDLRSLKWTEHSSNKEELPANQFAHGQYGAQQQNELRARERERIVLQEYAPHGLTLTPPGSFAENEGRLCMDDIDEGMFDEHLAKAPRSQPTGVSNNEEYQRKAVSFESMSEPFDEYAEDYLKGILCD